MSLVAHSPFALAGGNTNDVSCADDLCTQHEP